LCKTVNAENNKRRLKAHKKWAQYGVRRPDKPGGFAPQKALGLLCLFSLKK
jgi:hypothetical protein